MKTVLRIVSVVLCIAMLAGVSAVAAENVGTTTAIEYFGDINAVQDSLLETDANEGKSGGSGCDCRYYPSVVIPGIFQSKVHYTDDEGNEMTDSAGNVISMPLFININDNLSEIIKIVLLPLLSMLITQRPCGFPKALAKAAGILFETNADDLNGNPKHNVAAESYTSSVATLTAEQKAHVYSSIKLKGFTDRAGEDHLYFMSYHSFGKNLEIAEQVYELIQTAKRETGHDKVNLVAVSLGGSIANILLEYYPEVYDDIHRLLFIVPALDGSNIVGDIMSGNFNKQNEQIYRDLFPFLLKGDESYMGYLINLLIRIVPKKVLYAALDEAVYELRDKLLRNCTCMWGLVPSAYYPELREKLLSGDEYAVIREQTDKYYKAQLNSRKNVQKLVDSGIEVFDIVDYNVPLYPVVPSWDKCNADGIIQVDSTTMGAYSIGVDVQLPADYVQANTHCADPTHNHISPDRCVDASTGLLPETTFYFYKQHHEGTGRNDVILKLATEIISSDRIKDVYSDPAFPQFNVGREALGFSGTVEWAKGYDTSKLSPEDAAEFKAAVEYADKVISNTVVNYDEYIAARTRLEKILVKIGERSDNSLTAKDKAKIFIFRTVSDAVYRFFGPRGWSDFRFVIPFEN